MKKRRDRNLNFNKESDHIPYGIAVCDYFLLKILQAQL